MKCWVQPWCHSLHSTAPAHRGSAALAVSAPWEQARALLCADLQSSGLLRSSGGDKNQTMGLPSTRGTWSQVLFPGWREDGGTHSIPAAPTHARATLQLLLHKDFLLSPWSGTSGDGTCSLRPLRWQGLLFCSWQGCFSVPREEPEPSWRPYKHTSSHTCSSQETQNALTWKGELLGPMGLKDIISMHCLVSASLWVQANQRQVQVCRAGGDMHSRQGFSPPSPPIPDRGMWGCALPCVVSRAQPCSPLAQAVPGRAPGAGAGTGHGPGRDPVGSRRRGQSCRVPRHCPCHRHAT